MKNQLISGAFFLGLCFATASAQSKIVMDARVDFESERAVSGVERGEEVRTRDAVGSDTFGKSRSRRGGLSVRVRSFDRRLVAAVYRECARYHIDPRLVFSLIWQESGGKLHLISAKGARGPMQLMPATAMKYGARNPFDPDQAVRAGVAFLVELLDEFSGNVSQALAGYNAGMVPVYAFSQGKRVVMGNKKVVNPRGIKTAGGIPPYRETQNYVESIANHYRGSRDGANVGAQPQ